MEEIKKIEVSVTPSNYVGRYLSLFYSALRLTQTEEKVLEQIVHSYIELKDNVAEPYLTELVLSSDRRKSMSEAVGITSPDFNNRIKGLKDKAIFISIDPLRIDPMLIPNLSITFTFKISEVVETKVLDKEEKPQEEVLVITEDNGIEKKVELIKKENEKSKK